MSKSQLTAVLIVGSAKAKGTSTSEALGSYLLDQMGKVGVESESFFVHRLTRTEARRQALYETIDNVDIVILAFPLYVDSLPHLVVKTLEGIAAHRQGAGGGHLPRFLAIANCGFPESHHNDLALDICRHFSDEARFRWAGGLSLGGGGMVGGRPLAESGGREGNITTALDLAAQALAEGDPIPEQAMMTMAQPSIPTGMYTTMGNMGWAFEATRQGTLRQLRAKPFKPQNGRELTTS